MIPQQPRRGCRESPSVGVGAVGLFSEASPNSVWKSAQNRRRRNDLAFKAFIWSSGAGSGFPVLGLASSVVVSMLLRECQCHTMELSTKSPGADSRRFTWPYSAVRHCVEA